MVPLRESTSAGNGHFCSKIPGKIATETDKQIIEFANQTQTVQLITLYMANCGI
jgi:hypothetical protein